MSNVNPSYQEVAKSGVSSQEKPGGGASPYVQQHLGGVAFPAEDDTTPPFPEHTPEQNYPYPAIKN